MKTVRDVAIVLEVTEEQVRKWIRNGKLKAFKVDAWQIKDEDFMIFLAEHPKYGNRYFLKTYGHKPPVNTSSKKTIRVTAKNIGMNEQGLKVLMSKIDPNWRL